MNIRSLAPALVLALVLVAGAPQPEGWGAPAPAPRQAQSPAALKEANIIDKAATVFNEVMATPDKAIPGAILENAEAIAIFPGMIRAGFVFGAQRGRGIISVHDRKAGTWSSPAFLTITGGSWGAQIGGQVIDLILVIRDRKGLENLLRNQFKIGGEASAAAGPVGRSAEASTDVQMRAKILSYSRSRGLFAGIALNGSTVHQDRDANERFYGSRYETGEIVLEGKGGAPAAAGVWRGALKQHMR